MKKLIFILSILITKSLFGNESSWIQLNEKKLNSIDYWITNGWSIINTSVKNFGYTEVDVYSLINSDGGIKICIVEYETIELMPVPKNTKCFKEKYK